MNKNSIAYWYPMIKDLVPTPITKIFPIEAIWNVDGTALTIDDKYFKEIEKGAWELTYPVFIRGSDASAKHEWEQTCFVKQKEDLRKQVGNVLLWSLDKMLDFSCIAVREYIEMDSGFKAFYLGMPVNPERRYFIRNGKVICHHPYWVEGAINGSKEELPENWKEILKEMNKEEQGEIDLLTSYAKKIAGVMDGYWSVDFCRTKKGKWVMIDMASGESSWHHEGCLNKLSTVAQGN